MRTHKLLSRLSAFIILVSVVTAAFISCSDKNNQKETTTESTTESKNDSVSHYLKMVMDQHEVSMNKMSDLMQRKSALSKLPPANKATADAIKHLQDANDAMMDWMHNFKNPEKVTDSAKTIIYLKNQLRKIDSVETDMNESLKDADLLLKNNQK